MATDLPLVTAEEDLMMEALNLGATRDEIAKVTKKSLDDMPEMVETTEPDSLNIRSILDDPDLTEEDRAYYTEAFIDQVSKKLIDADISAPESSSFDKFSKHFWSTPSFSRNAMHILESNFPELAGEVEMFDPDTGYFSPSWKTAEEKFGEDFFLLSPEERRQEIIKTRAEELALEYADVREGAGVIPKYTGMAAGILADPTTLLVPMGNTYKAAALIGAGVGTVDSLAHQYAQTGEVDAGDTAIAAGLGAILGPLGFYLVRRLPAAIRSNIDDGVPVTEDQVQDAIAHSMTEANKSQLLTINPAKLARDINIKFDLNGKSFDVATDRKNKARYLGDTSEDVGLQLQAEKRNWTQKEKEEEIAYLAREKEFVISDEQVDKDLDKLVLSLSKDKAEARKKILESNVSASEKQKRLADFDERAKDLRKGEPTAMEQAFRNAADKQGIEIESTYKDFDDLMKATPPEVKQSMVDDIVDNVEDTIAGTSAKSTDDLVRRAQSTQDLGFASGKMGPEHYTRIGHMLEQGDEGLLKWTKQLLHGNKLAVSPKMSFASVGKAGRMFNKANG